eukprot:TRINITY_DN7432_c0_g1_i1.p1 TRINITY_DN7432_c0_g1~~TRINITY_DN7432_c0_g1_i1.p1  ORF type:complete len:277 (-),score=-25.82 TRINITY_DN7432_c0_g1_i1:155-985(-)
MYYHITFNTYVPSSIHQLSITLTMLSQCNAQHNYLMLSYIIMVFMTHLLILNYHFTCVLKYTDMLKDAHILNVAFRISKLELGNYNITGQDASRPCYLYYIQERVFQVVHRSHKQHKRSQIASLYDYLFTCTTYYTQQLEITIQEKSFQMTAEGKQSPIYSIIQKIKPYQPQFIQQTQFQPYTFNSAVKIKSLQIVQRKKKLQKVPLLIPKKNSQIVSSQKILSSPVSIHHNTQVYGMQFQTGKTSHPNILQDIILDSSLLHSTRQQEKDSKYECN